MRSEWMSGLIAIAAASRAVVCSTQQTGRPGAYTPHTRNYYIQAENIAWNYAPQGSDPVFGRSIPFPWGERTVFQKQHYVGYTDGTFTKRLAVPPWQGILGPTLRAVTGDTMRVTFRNRTGVPLSIHPHGVRYRKQDEGSVYGLVKEPGDSVLPGYTYMYTWRVLPESGPRKGEPSSKVWLYHSHVRGDADAYRGLVGTIIVTDPAHARADATPDDVDVEFVTLWMIFDERGPGMHGGGGNTGEPDDASLLHSINGLIFGNLQGLVMDEGNRVRWYLVALGNEGDWHTPHWHGQTLLVRDTYTDVVELGPASMAVADMVADNPGVWMLHCHVADHMMSGMYTTYTILNAAASRRTGAARSAGFH